MRYNEALNVLRNGGKVRLPEWTGYWFKDAQGVVMAFTRTGDLLPAWCDKDHDVKGFITRSDWQEVTEGLGFDFAILALKAGKKVAREGWNGKGMFLIMAGGYKVPKDNMRPGTHITPELLEQRGVSDLEIVPHIDMWSAQNTYVTGWLASQTDMLANDWTVVA